MARRSLRRPRLDRRELQHPGTPSAGPGPGPLVRRGAPLGPAFAYRILSCAGLQAGFGALEVTGYPAPRTTSCDLHCFQANKHLAAVGFCQTLTPARRFGPPRFGSSSSDLGGHGSWATWGPGYESAFHLMPVPVQCIKFYLRFSRDLVTYYPLIPSN